MANVGAVAIMAGCDLNVPFLSSVRLLALSQEDVKSKLSDTKKLVEKLDVELPSEFECCFCTTKVVY